MSDFMLAGCIFAPVVILVLVFTTPREPQKWAWLREYHRDHGIPWTGCPCGHGIGAYGTHCYVCGRKLTDRSLWVRGEEPWQKKSPARTFVNFIRMRGDA